jgi:hypothetical protein
MVMNLGVSIHPTPPTFLVKHAISYFLNSSPSFVTIITSSHPIAMGRVFEELVCMWITLLDLHSFILLPLPNYTHYNLIT